MVRMNGPLAAILLAASYVVTVPVAKAQSYVASFTLPVEAHFGNTLLEPGEYTVSTVNGALRIQGEHSAATVLAASIDTQSEVNHSNITLVNVNGNFALEHFQSGVLGKKFDFVPAKSLSRGMERASIAQPSSIDIALK